jgi:flagellar biosynthesis/type III secretory pathway protein FliH
MNSVIKSADAANHGAIRPLQQFTTGAPTIVASRPEDERDVLRRRIASLEASMRERDAAIEALHLDVGHALEKGKKEGHATGLAEAADQQEKRLAALGVATKQAGEKLSTALTALDRLAVALARECLDKILGDPAYRAEQVEAAIRTQIEKIDKKMLVGIEVSPKDFASIEDLASHLHLPAVCVSATTDIPSGGCIMRLKLGHLVVGAMQQWSVLSQTLDEMAEPA